MTFNIKVYGCQYNAWDAIRLSFALTKLGFQESSEKEAEIIFVMLCSVRKSAIDRALGKIKNWQNKKVVVTGCVLENDRPTFINKNAILWNNEDFTALNKILDKKFTQQELKALFDERNVNSNFIPIMKGCNNFCTYCAVPYTRGREISRPFEEVVTGAKKLIKEGKKEIFLLGQNVNSYEFGFDKLLEAINDIPGNFKIKFTSNHPKDMSKEIIQAISDLEKVEKSIHLPLQSGSNKILKAMNRPYTKKNYSDLIQTMRGLIPELKISTDIIVGFPGENEEEFEETLELCQEIGFEKAFINKYSPRAGTKAFALGDPVSWKEKERRWKILNDLINKK